jgi:hypothetical protein
MIKGDLITVQIFFRNRPKDRYIYISYAHIFSDFSFDCFIFLHIFSSSILLFFSVLLYNNKVIAILKEIIGIDSQVTPSIRPMNINGLYNHWKEHTVNNNQIVFYLLHKLDLGSVLIK